MLPPSNLMTAMFRDDRAIAFAYLGATDPRILRVAVKTKDGLPPYRPCVGVMLVNQAGLVFVGRRLDTQDAWQMPQGGIDKGESPRAAALRELVEETGIDKVEILAETADWHRYDFPPELKGKVWKGKYRGQEQKWVLCRFCGMDSDINLATAHPEFDAWQWVSPDVLVDLIVPFKRAIYAAVVTEFRPRLVSMR